MSEYKLKVTLLSEAIFNSGEEEQNLVNEKVLADEDGFVYFHAKTLKGQLKERAEWLGDILAGVESKGKIKSYEKSIIKLFGSKFGGKSNKKGTMTLSNLELTEEIRDYFKNINSEEDDFKYKITPYDLIEAQTNRRTRIQIGEDGTNKDKMMMTYHSVKEGLEFYSHINFLEKINDKDLTALNVVVNSLRSIGSSTNRGRGKVKAELLDQQDKKVSANDLGVFLDE